MPENLFQCGRPTFATARNKFATAARPKKCPEGQTLYTRSREFSTLTLHISDSVNKKCPNLVVSWLGVQGPTFTTQFHSLVEKKMPKIGNAKAPKSAGEAIATDSILTFVDRP